MPAPGAVLAALVLLLAGGATAAAMPAPDRPGGNGKPDRPAGKPETTAPGPTATTTAPGETTPPATTGTPEQAPGQAEDRPRDAEERPSPPEHAQDDKPRLDGRADPPALGKSVVVDEAAGTVSVRLPGAAADEAIEHTEDIPVGSVVDVRRGAVVLSSAIDRAGTQQQAVFHGGRFEVRQGPDGYVDVHLRGPRGTCPPRRGRARSAAAGPRRRPHRKLWGQDDHGRFRTHGKDAVATVRGTMWLVQERCDGTKVSVGWGAVDVFDRRTRRTVRVGAQQSYLARAR